MQETGKEESVNNVKFNIDPEKLLTDHEKENETKTVERRNAKLNQELEAEVKSEEKN